MQLIPIRQNSDISSPFHVCDTNDFVHLQILVIYPRRLTRVKWDNCTPCELLSYHLDAIANIHRLLNSKHPTHQVYKWSQYLERVLQTGWWVPYHHICTAIFSHRDNIHVDRWHVNTVDFACHSSGKPEIFPFMSHFKRIVMENKKQLSQHNLNGERRQVRR